MSRAERIAQARTTRDTVERLLNAHAGPDADRAVRAELRRYLSELHCLLTALETGIESAGRGESADGARDAHTN
jgi:hypothetical protein